MKNSINKIIWVLTFMAITMPSCKKGFEEINTSPNTSPYALPQALLAPALTSTVAANMSRTRSLQNELMQVSLNLGDSDGKVFRYDIRRVEGDYLWNSWYIQLTNFKDIYTFASDPLTYNKTYMAISLISQSWIYAMLTDTYGDVPYFESNKAKDGVGVFTPKFDSQKAIYLDIFKKLEEANDLLKTSAPNVVATSDPVYGGIAANWRKFGNSLYLRLLLRLSGKSEVSSDCIAKIKDIVNTNAANYPLIATNEESAILKWTGVAPYVSPFISVRVQDWPQPKLAEFFVNNLTKWADPRIAKWATTSLGAYAGIPGGYPVGQTPVGRSSQPLALQSEPLLGNIMSYAELQFILAEAAAKGYVTGSAATFYTNGVNNGISLWGYTPSATYLTDADIAWDDAASLDQKMEMIHVQKYYAMFMTDLEQWFEYRRTGHPVLPKGQGLKNNGVMPARLTYPGYVQSANPDSYRAAVLAQGVDEIYTQVWWQKP